MYCAAMIASLYQLAITTEQLYGIFALANIAGATILIPHTGGAGSTGGID